MNISPKLLILSGILILLGLGGFYAFFTFSDQGIVVAPPVAVTPSPSQSDEPKCLEDDEYAEHSLNLDTLNSVRIAYIHVKNKKTGEIIREFEAPVIRRPVEIRDCHVYTNRSFDYDYINRKTLYNYKAEIWQYDYHGNGRPIILLGESVNGEYIPTGLSSDFRVSRNEQYIILERGYLGWDNHALIIKDLHTLKDLSILSAQDVFDKDPEKIGSIMPLEWTEDSRYFWFNLFMGANVSAFVRIDASDWTWEFFPAPQNTMGGDALNYETGWVTHNTLGIWTGIHELSQQIKEQYQKEGKTGIFALYNLFTQEQIVLETATDPTYFFKPKWISDNEIEYEMPNGEKKIYKID